MDKFKKVMGELKRGELHSGSKKGPLVTSTKQAKAIAVSEAKKANQYAMTPEERVAEGYSPTPAAYGGSDIKGANANRMKQHDVLFSQGYIEGARHALQRKQGHQNPFHPKNDHIRHQAWNLAHSEFSNMIGMSGGENHSSSTYTEQHNLGGQAGDTEVKYAAKDAVETADLPTNDYNSFLDYIPAGKTKKTIWRGNHSPKQGGPGNTPTLDTPKTGTLISAEDADAAKKRATSLRSKHGKRFEYSVESPVSSEEAKAAEQAKVRHFERQSDWKKLPIPYAEPHTPPFVTPSDTEKKVPEPHTPPFTLPSDKEKEIPEPHTPPFTIGKSKKKVHEPHTPPFVS